MFIVGLGFDLVFCVCSVGCHYHCTSAVSCLKRLVFEMTCYVLSWTLNFTH